MSIKLYVGKVGSGKTASAVKEIVQNSHCTVYSNIVPKKRVSHWNVISKDMIIKQRHEGTVRKRDGTTQPIIKEELNVDFWKKAVQKNDVVSVVLDELHNIVSARTSMSKKNIIFNKWLSLIRRMLGSDPQVQGDLIIISQLTRQVDVIAREMAHQVRYHVASYVKTCGRCGVRWFETSDAPEEIRLCIRCGHYKLVKSRFRIYVYCFESVEHYEMFSQYGQKSWFKRYVITDIEKYFGFYDTLQLENLFD